MLKQRIWVWILVIILTWGTKGVIQLCTTPATYIYISYNVEKDPELSKIKSISKFKTKTNFNIKGEKPDIVISSDNENLSGYTKKEAAYMSPLIMYAGNAILFNDSGFVLEKGNDSYIDDNVASKDLKDILMAIEKDKSWQDIGVPENVFSGKVKLAIPKKDNRLYQLVKDLFIVNLEDVYKENTEEKVNIILDKCEQVDDLSNYIMNMDESNEINKIVPLIAPESYVTYLNSNVTSSSKKSKYIVPVYFTKTVALKYNWYEKNDLTEKQTNKINKMYSAKNMLMKLGIRPLYEQINLSKLNSHCKEDLIIKN